MFAHHVRICNLNYYICRSEFHYLPCEALKRLSIGNVLLPFETHYILEIASSDIKSCKKTAQGKNPCAVLLGEQRIVHFGKANEKPQL